MKSTHHPKIEIPNWPYVYGGPEGIGKIKVFPDDFVVDEQLPFQPDGSGEHVFLKIEKCGENTEYVARLLSRFAGVRQRDVSYAGLKDRHARTTQWFSVWLPGKDDPDWKQIETENIKILNNIRHARKLKRGVLSGNNFQILLRDFQGDRKKVEQQLLLIKEQGIPNYFGAQRFGYKGQNLNKALALFQGEKVKREQRSIYLSAVRSYLFNQQLAKRIMAGTWNQAILGDVFVFNQSNSYFKTDQLDHSIIKRIDLGEIHPSGMMFGKGERETKDDALEIENTIINENKSLTDGLINNGLRTDRRALRVNTSNLIWEFKVESSLLLSFSLPAGSYATSLLRELINSDTQPL